jgi:hypothetical protein
MTKLRKQKAPLKQSKKDYPRLKSINGKHPLQKVAPESVVEYKVRSRNGGKVAFFNFDLAKEMGLIPKDHPCELNNKLIEEIMDTFSIVIINEYDEINNINFPKDEIKPHKYMATRYLQLQHPNKQGRTSGDGRSVWNGSVNYRGKTWDISSCGTGATCLSPATSLNNKFYKTGDPSISYGCGYSEVDEGFASLFFSEIFNRNGIGTERVLGIIEFAKGLSINIRVHNNLLRPSHLFRHLKLGHPEQLKDLVNYYIDRQEANGAWENIPTRSKNRFEYFLKKQAETFSKLSATFEDEYIFCWMDWDGDNILMDGSIIDYGSVRQFGLYHHEYRYDDDDRYSTSIREQKQKARYTVQTFAQVVDYIKTGEKKPLESFKNDASLEHFDITFTEQKNTNILRKLGFNDKQTQSLLKNHLDTVEGFRKTFNYFEMAKSKDGLYKVEDGINWNAIFCMRDILRELPQLYLSRGESITSDEFIEIIKSDYATKEDLDANSYRDKKVFQFQQDYWKLVKSAANSSKLSVNRTLLEISMRSSIINKYDRVTGDSVSTIIDKVMKRKPKMSAEEIYKFLSNFTEYQSLDPDNKRKQVVTKDDRFFKGMLKIVREYREGL